MKHLACFFKNPEGVEENDYFKQFDLLIDHVQSRDEQARVMRSALSTTPH